MNSKLGISAVIILLVISGCSSMNLHEVYRKDDVVSSGDHPLDKAGECEDKSWLPYRSCGYHFFECKNQNPWTNDSQQVVQAVENFEYAMMASNSYKYDPTTIAYEISRWTQVSRMESDSGLSIDVYERRTNSQVIEEVAIVYEGTNFDSANDWKFNFAITQPNQYKEAVKHAQVVRNKYQGIPITAVGHSLGGGLALNVSMHIENVKGIAFNSSPRAFWGDEDQDNANPRVHLYEVGEILSPMTRTYLRIRLSGDQMLPVKYNYLDYTNTTQAISEHSMYNLSRGLLLTAIKGGSQEAIEAFTTNIGQEKAKIDNVYCPKIFNQQVEQVNAADR